MVMGETLDQVVWVHALAEVLHCFLQKDTLLSQEPLSTQKLKI